MHDEILNEALRLHKMGMAIHWLHNKSKRPIESKWTSGPRKNWDELKKTYRKGLNVGVRLGTPSKIKDKFLAVIDVDVKSTDPAHSAEVQEHLKKLLPKNVLPEVNSGRGNGSKHFYILTPTPIKPFKAVQSKDLVKVLMPSVMPSKREVAALSDEELSKGIRLRPAWEIALMGDGQQVVLPPSIHPDSGKSYVWHRDFEVDSATGFDIAKLIVDNSVDKPASTEKQKTPVVENLGAFNFINVELSWLPISQKIKNMILSGEGVEDRSAMLLPICQALFRAGLSREETLSVLTDPENYMGQVGYHHAKTHDRARAAAWVWKYSLEKVERENSMENIFRDDETTKKLSDEEIKESQLLFDDLHDWQLDLDQTKEDKTRPTLRNVVMILENAVGKDVIARDTFSYRDFYKYATPWGGEKNAAIVDDDLVKIKHWLANNWGVEPNSNTIGEALTFIATRNSFDPVVQWLDGLPAWDEVPRIDTWLSKYFGAKGNEEYLAQVFRKWLCAMVMRAYKPGTKFDWMPIFEGAQGVGKSSFGRLICGDKHFLDWLPDLANKDSALALQGIWCVEMGELASFRKNEIEAVKAFITRTVDKVRPPYGQRWLEIPRRCVFFGTTNFETYLKDDSGNRRYKPVLVGQLNFRALHRDREQLFAEAIWLYKTGFETSQTLDTFGEARVYEIELQGEKMVADEASLMREKLSDFFASENGKENGEKFSLTKFKISDLFQVGTGAAFYSPPLEKWKFDSRNVQFASKAMKLLGGINWKSDGVKYWKITI